MSKNKEEEKKINSVNLRPLFLIKYCRLEVRDPLEPSTDDKR